MATESANTSLPAHRVAKVLGWRVLERCGGGEFGAYLVERRGERAVLKAWGEIDSADSLRRSVAVAERARERGQLVPRYFDIGVVDGISYAMQEFIVGELPEPLTLGHARQLVELLGAHVDAAAGVDYHPPHWARDWDPVAMLPMSNPRVRALSDELGAAPTIAALGPRTTDVVHGDYHHRNLLVRGQRVVTVFDWESAHPGDWRADLFKLTWWCNVATEQVTRPAARWIREQAVAALDDRELAAHAADLAGWVVEWFARERPEVLDSWLLDAVERELAPFWQAV